MSRADRLAKGIYWDRSWNPFTGCSPVGAGCDNCWARRMAARLRGRCGYPADEPFRPTFHPDRLSQVNSTQKPQVIAVCFMSDPFHEAHQDKDILRMLYQATRCPQHIFIALTKRPERMADILDYYSNYSIPNLVGGVSVWDQPSADRMISILLEMNLATRIVSLEPCLGAVDIRKHLSLFSHQALFHRVNGVIMGGESGPGARPMHPDWARSVRDHCQAANVPFLFKQHGEYVEWDRDKWGAPSIYDCPWGALEPAMKRVGKKAAGRLLDGRMWDELPEVMNAPAGEKALETT